ncbi:proteasome activator pa28 REG alpha beta subunit [Suillus fuscotomentosus]|uniref:Proteasome activator pa28 REG alpha beta subunit n=1 Tax=Suillus fuscotomentosus TaxID=1912939 RepID=A0AAD4ELC6_9AGAM|nr:proteasome activator pa28 REG alpha beta subunit [Suillus fuscotomentosus]KAG1908318.1 proteasome activator pa28 REG alpha beta subunit [Suillus fuscotomentosus]
MILTTMSMTKEVAKSIEDFRTKVAETAEGIVFRVFPNKASYLLELTGLIESMNAQDSPYQLSQAATSTDTTVHPPPSSTETNGSSNKLPRPSHLNETVNARYPERVHANKLISKLHETVKLECAQLSDSCDKVKLWVNLTMPNGVQIQEEVLSELLRSQESAYNIRDAARQHHLARAKICSKLIKYPHIEDYTLGLKEHDEKQFFFSRQNLIDMRNVYAVLTDILHKNIAKIRAPKGNNGVGLY